MPLRNSLVAQVVSIIRSEIASGIWQELLPSEQELCAQLHVSRTSLRLALAQLERDGWITNGQGRRRQVSRGLRSLNRQNRNKSKDVVLLTPKPLSSITPFAMFWMDELRRCLSEAGYRLEIHANQNCYRRRPHNILKTLAERYCPAGWVLYLSTPEMQRWFASQKLPCIITGSHHSGIVSVSVDLHYRAACRHASSRLISNGHRRLALIIQESELAGDYETEAGFKEGASRYPNVNAEVNIIRHDGTRAGLLAQLDAMLDRSKPVTALLIANPADVLTALGHIHARGLRVPMDIALVSRDDEPFLKHVVPPVARYAVNPALFARKVSRAVLELAQSGVVQPHNYRLIPRFISGGTLE